MRVAMVCLGNICRSPMAESVGQAMVDRAGLGDRVTVESFGTAGYHIGEPADVGATAALRRRGWPADGHRARRIQRHDVATSDLVLCADRAVLAEVRRLAGPGRGPIMLLRSFDPAATAADEEVPDPWGGDAVAFDRALDLIERACRGLVDGLVEPPH
ncbi:MAG: low molecular weight phosphotyrosine protein phosphatase [Actinomycetota bacterium]|nr:low molecular weight phosphotyrosine protein phosphatase [Actinomycetota bacterium]